MKNSILNLLTFFIFTLFSLGCSSIPPSAISDNSSTATTQTEPQPEEEPECE